MNLERHEVLLLNYFGKIIKDLPEEDYRVNLDFVLDNNQIELLQQDFKSIFGESDSKISNGTLWLTDIADYFETKTAKYLEEQDGENTG